MDKQNFRLDSDAKKKINNEFARPDDTTRVNGPRRRPVRRPAPPKPQTQPYPPQSAAPGRRVVRRPAPPPQYIPPEPVYQPEQGYEPDPLPKKPKRHRLAKLLFRIAVLGVVVILLNVMFFYYRGQIWFNEPRKRDYPVRGAVVTESLGKVDWEKFAGQNISFVYIRATRGKTEVDEQYKANRRGANNTDLLCGYYHEFDFRVDGVKQAENYIEQAGTLEGKLRPMVKVTRYGIYRILPKDGEKAAKELQAFIDRINEEYGCDCIIQCDRDCYNRYIGGDFSDYYDIWLISHFTEPDLKEYAWTLWEYNPRVRTATYSNKNEYYCMSVFSKGTSLGRFKKDFLISYEE
ncbi:MAG: hypothetical protein IJ723_04580 [Ruminococcus sp.]|nr:hypothetical protein [Ruminococcus sp.]